MTAGTSLIGAEEEGDAPAQLERGGGAGGGRRGDCDLGDLGDEPADESVTAGNGKASRYVRKATVG